VAVANANKKAKAAAAHVSRATLAATRDPRRYRLTRSLLAEWTNNQDAVGRELIDLLSLR
jgi:hypothetical protein